jgi:hypothetical protein
MVEVFQRLEEYVILVLVEIWTVESLSLKECTHVTINAFTDLDLHDL